MTFNDPQEPWAGGYFTVTGSGHDFLWLRQGRVTKYPKNFESHHPTPSGHDFLWLRQGRVTKYPKNFESHLPTPC